MGFDVTVAAKIKKCGFAIPVPGPQQQKNKQRKNGSEKT